MFITASRQEYHGMTGFFEFIGNRVPTIHDAYGKTDERRRNFKIHKSTTHGILSANGRKAQLAASFVGS